MEEEYNEIQSLTPIIYIFRLKKRKNERCIHISDCISTMAGMSKFPAVYRHGFVLGRIAMIDLDYNLHFFGFISIIHGSIILDDSSMASSKIKTVKHLII